VLTEKLIEIAESIPEYLMSGRIVPEIKNVNLRERLYESYRVIYRISPMFIEIVAVRHCARELYGIPD